MSDYENDYKSAIREVKKLRGVVRRIDYNISLYQRAVLERLIKLNEENGYGKIHVKAVLDAIANRPPDAKKFEGNIYEEIKAEIEKKKADPEYFDPDESNEDKQARWELTAYFNVLRKWGYTDNELSAITILADEGGVDWVDNYYERMKEAKKEEKLNPVKPDKIFIEKLTEKKQLELAVDETVSPEILKELAKSKYVDVMVETAENPNTPEEVLKEFAGSENKELRKAVAKNPVAGAEILDKLSKDEDEDVRYYVAKNKNTAPEVLRHLSEEEKGFEYSALNMVLAMNLRTPVDVLEMIAGNKGCQGSKEAIESLKEIEKRKQCDWETIFAESKTPLEIKETIVSRPETTFAGQVKNESSESKNSLAADHITGIRIMENEKNKNVEALANHLAMSEWKRQILARYAADAAQREKIKNAFDFIDCVSFNSAVQFYHSPYYGKTRAVPLRLRLNEPEDFKETVDVLKKHDLFFGYIKETYKNALLRVTDLEEYLKYGILEKRPLKESLKEANKDFENIKKFNIAYAPEWEEKMDVKEMVKKREDEWAVWHKENFTDEPVENHGPLSIENTYAFYDLNGKFNLKDAVITPEDVRAVKLMTLYYKNENGNENLEKFHNQLEENYGSKKKAEKRFALLENALGGYFGWGQGSYTCFYLNIPNKIMKPDTVNKTNTALQIPSPEVNESVAKPQTPFAGQNLNESSEPEISVSTVHIGKIRDMFIEALEKDKLPFNKSVMPGTTELPYIMFKEELFDRSNSVAAALHMALIDSDDPRYCGEGMVEENFALVKNAVPFKAFYKITKENGEYKEIEKVFYNAKQVEGDGLQEYEKPPEIKNALDYVYKAEKRETPAEQLQENITKWQIALETNHPFLPPEKDFTNKEYIDAIRGLTDKQLALLCYAACKEADKILEGYGKKPKIENNFKIKGNGIKL